MLVNFTRRVFKTNGPTNCYYMIIISPIINKSNSFFDFQGREIPMDAILIYKGRKEMVVQVTDLEIRNTIINYLKTADTFFPQLKFLTTFLENANLAYALLPTDKNNTEV